MLIRIGFALAAYAAAAVFTVPKLKQARKRDKAACLLIFLFSLYFALAFVLEQKWPNFDELTDVTLGKAAQQIVQMLKKDES